MTDLNIQVTITAPDGSHQLEDEANGYWLHSDSLNTRVTPQRNVMHDGDWTEGSVAVRSTRGNVVETLAIWCDGTTPAEFQTRFNALKAWFNQRRYTITVDHDDSTETWVCPQPGEYTEDLNQVFRAATRGLLRVQVARLPFGDG